MGLRVLIFFTLQQTRELGLVQEATLVRCKGGWLHSRD